jgi:NTE family protein
MDRLSAAAADERTALKRIATMRAFGSPVAEAARRAAIAARLPIHEWPRCRLLVTAIDAETGELVRFDERSGVALIDAVSASCASPGLWPSVLIDGRRYVDGGIRSRTNADLAAVTTRSSSSRPTP